MTSSGSPITQVAEHDIYSDLIQEEYKSSLPSRSVKLNLRGERVDVEVETLVLFPDSFTLCMFPDGLHPFTHGSSRALFDKVHSINLDPACFHYLHSFLQQTHQISLDHQLSGVSLSTHPLLATKQLVIVLREDLDYFVLPQSAHHDQYDLKTRAGQYLVKANKIFDALIRNIEKEDNRAEQHLVTMLYEAGFNTEDQWAYRALDPKRTCITSLSLSRLSSMEEDQGDIIQRFMLFWKKPARKCWWDAELLDLDTVSIRLWKRRTFWLELAAA